jgi:protein-tyrosine-phosphatase
VIRVLFVCIRNASLARTAASLFNDLAAPALAQATPAGETTVSADVVVFLGGGRDRALPTARMIDWIVPDPAGQPLERVRQIRDELAGRVRGLVSWGGWLPLARAA